MRKRETRVISIVFLFVTLFEFGLAQTLDRVPVEVAEVKRENFKKTIPAIGTVAHRRRAVVKTKVSGRIESIYVEEGDFVSGGDILALLEQVQFEIEQVRALDVLCVAGSQARRLHSGERKASVDRGKPAGTS